MAAPAAFPIEKGWKLLLRDLGLDIRAALRRADLPEDLFSRDGASLTTQQFFGLWEAVQIESAEPDFPIRAVQATRTEGFHPLLFAALCSPDFVRAAQRIAHYKQLIAPMRLLLDDTSGGFRVEFQWLDRSVHAPASLAAFELAFVVQLVRLATREHIVPLRVESAAEFPPCDCFESFFGSRVLSSDAHAVTFARADVRLPFLTSNEEMWRIFEPSLRRRLVDLEQGASFEQRVRAALLEGLPSGQGSMGQVAKKLALSKRTLQRRLREEATTFQTLLNSTREALARHYLERTELSGAEISYLLGFEDPNSFFRAFHTWTGMTTEQLRPHERAG